MLTRRAFVGSLALAPSARAQERFPARPVKIINSLAAGSATDVRARVIAGELTKIWGQQAIVENRPGGGGALPYLLRLELCERRGDDLGGIVRCQLYHGHPRR